MTALALLLFACTGAPVDTGDTAVPEDVHPRWMLTANMADTVRARLDHPDMQPVVDALRERAAREVEAPVDPAEWDHNSNGHNAETAQSAALLAYLEHDADQAAHAIALLDSLQLDYDTHDQWDINIRMPHTLVGVTNAIDLLLATDFYDHEQAAPHIEALQTINSAFFDEFVEDDGKRVLVLGQAQNNHPIRTAVAIGTVALMFPDYSDAEEHASWAMSELDYLWGPDGRYVQPDGGVSEGPFYFGFAWGVSTAFFIGVHNTGSDVRTFTRDCRNRSERDPWLVTEEICAEGEAFTFSNPLLRDDYHNTARWSQRISLPGGLRPPLADAYMNPFNGGALLTGFGGDDSHVWDWKNSVERPFQMTHGADLIPYHLAWWDPDAFPGAEPPDELSLRFPSTGHAVLRSDWTPEARWALLVAESGASRKTLHDHADGLSVSVAAYGEYLLVDPGYYKLGDLELPITAQPEAHNLPLIDGVGGPDKGLLTNWGDVDTQLGQLSVEGRVEAVSASKTWADTTVTRWLLQVDGRYHVVVDQPVTTVTEPRSYAVRWGGNAGFSVGGSYEVSSPTARFTRDKAGIDVMVAATAPGLEVAEVPYVEGKAPHVGKYDLGRNLTHHAVVDGTVTAVAPTLLSVLAPYAVGATDDSAPLTLEPRTDAPTGWAGIDVTHSAGTDTWWVREPNATSSGPAELDGAEVYGVLASGETFSR